MFGSHETSRVHGKHVSLSQGKQDSSHKASNPNLNSHAVKDMMSIAHLQTQNGADLDDNIKRANNEL